MAKTASKKVVSKKTTKDKAKAIAPKTAPVKPVAKAAAPVVPAKVAKNNTNGQKVATPLAAKAAAAKVAAIKPTSKSLAAAVAPVVGKVEKKLKKLKLKKKKDKSFTNLPVPPAPVMSDAKPKKNQAGLTAKELEHFRDLLLAKRRELLGDMSSMEREALRSGGSNLSNLPVHMADMGTDNYEQEFTLGIVEKDRELIREINQALAKIQNGTYGVCEGTGKPISKPRLEAQPWAKFSIEHARMMEKRRNFANPTW